VRDVEIDAGRGVCKLGPAARSAADRHLRRGNALHVPEQQAQRRAPRDPPVPKRSARANSAGDSQAAILAISPGVRSSPHHHKAMPGAAGFTPRRLSAALHGVPKAWNPFNLPPFSAMIASDK